MVVVYVYKRPSQWLSTIHTCAHAHTLTHACACVHTHTHARTHLYTLAWQVWIIIENGYCGIGIRCYVDPKRGAKVHLKVFVLFWKHVIVSERDNY